MILPRLACPSDRVLRDNIKKSPANEGWSLEDYRAFWGGGSSKFVVTNHSYNVVCRCHTSHTSWIAKIHFTSLGLFIDTFDLGVADLQNPHFPVSSVVFFPVQYGCNKHNKQEPTYGAADSRNEHNAFHCLRSNSLSDSTSFFFPHITAHVGKHDFNDAHVPLIHVFSNELGHHILKLLAFSIAGTAQELQAHFMQHVRPKWYMSCVVIMEGIAEIPEKPSAICNASNSSHQGQVLAPSQIMRTKCGADGCKRLTSGVQGGIALCGQFKWYVLCHVALLSELVYKVIINHHVARCETFICSYRYV